MRADRHQTRPWALVVGYPDGSTVTLGWSARVCGRVDIDGIPRAVESILAAVDTAIERQRADHG